MHNDQHILWLQEGVPSWNERRERDPFTPGFIPHFSCTKFSRKPTNATRTDGYNFLV